MDMDPAGPINNLYRVNFTYLEPGYAQARGIDVIAYPAAFYVNASDPDTAILRATDLFHQAQRASGVGWIREIQTAAAHLAPETDARVTSPKTTSDATRAQRRRATDSR